MGKMRVTDDVLLFKKPKGGADGFCMIEAGTVVEATGSRVTDQTVEGTWTFQEVKHEKRTGYILEIRLEPVQGQG